MYHDVINQGNPDESGFTGKGPANYKYSFEEFSNHLNFISKSLKSKPSIASDLKNNTSKPYLITFDDVGLSAFTVIAPLLDSLGWKGHFFISTDFIDKPGFMKNEQIKELHQRGHIIGSHSCSHPKIFSKLSTPEMNYEWSKSIDVLSGIINQSVELASVPGGFYSKKVGLSAAQNGIKILFTSEPHQRYYYLLDCLIVGRYTMFVSKTAEFAGKIASGDLLTCFGEYAYWNIKKLAKNLAGEYYLKFRNFVIERRS